MGVYIVRRVIMGLILALIASSITFFAARMLPGDPILLYSASSQGIMTEEHANLLRHQNGLDRPIIAQYWSWLKDILHFRLGYSIYYHENVSMLLADRLPITLYLGIVSLAISAIAGIALGMAAAARQGRWLDTLIMGIANCSLAVPGFWLCVLMIYIFGLKLRWAPIGGYVSPFDDIYEHLQKAAMPVICLSIPGIAAIARQMRASMLEVFRQDYIRTAWAKGMNEMEILFRHALKNSLIPVITILGAGMGIIFGGAIIIETVYAIPGIGRLMASSVFAKDYVVIQSGTLILGLISILINVLVDIAYSWCDPRIQHS